MKYSYIRILQLPIVSQGINEISFEICNFSYAICSSTSYILNNFNLSDIKDWNQAGKSQKKISIEQGK